MRSGTWSEFREHCARPERVVWAVSAYDGKRSICPLGWKMNTSISPPMMAISVAPGRFSHGLISGSGEFVLAWPGADLAEKTMLCGTSSGRDIDKFAEAELTALPATEVQAPLVAECIANLECRVVEQVTTGDHTIFVGEVVAIWVSEVPSRQLCSIDHSRGYDFLVERGGYRFGVVTE
ncbi:MAG: flavin reductase family protein [Lentisphaerae bacterium]|jgi:flavin reductase (DIM6/NTAB) family NADH-FMN oxidoreductase RutF|nr:flavin reductase family protein [Lentisphaerota bacterium]MBT5610396.1 flavin reductase family protein [Lentisphaerota bacterium]MBT7056224.1 flavin reductase family protein [Lentisphaerota bacterium]MBT7841854.1 flavin reductase family protein [Lentisphaerota bacterium]